MVQPSAYALICCTPGKCSPPRYAARLLPGTLAMIFSGNNQKQIAMPPEVYCLPVGLLIAGSIAS